jgi:hypothetical protein
MDDSKGVTELTQEELEKIVTDSEFPALSLSPANHHLSNALTELQTRDTDEQQQKNAHDKEEEAESVDKSEEEEAESVDKSEEKEESREMAEEEAESVDNSEEEEESGERAEEEEQKQKFHDAKKLCLFELSLNMLSKLPLRESILSKLNSSENHGENNLEMIMQELYEVEHTKDFPDIEKTPRVAILEDIKNQVFVLCREVRRGKTKTLSQKMIEVHKIIWNTALMKPNFSTVNLFQNKDSFPFNTDRFNIGNFEATSPNLLKSGLSTAGIEQKQYFSETHTNLGSKEDLVRQQAITKVKNQKMSDTMRTSLNQVLSNHKGFSATLVVLLQLKFIEDEKNDMEPTPPSSPVLHHIGFERPNSVPQDAQNVFSQEKIFTLEEIRNPHKNKDRPEQVLSDTVKSLQLTTALDQQERMQHEMSASLGTMTELVSNLCVVKRMETEDGEDLLKMCKNLIHLASVPSRKRAKNLDPSAKPAHDKVITTSTSTLAQPPVTISPPPITLAQPPVTISPPPITLAQPPVTPPQTPYEPMLGIDYIDLGRKSPATRLYVKMKHDVISHNNDKSEEENRRNKEKSADDPMELAVEEDYFWRDSEQSPEDPILKQLISRKDWRTNHVEVMSDAENRLEMKIATNNRMVLLKKQMFAACVRKRNYEAWVLNNIFTFMSGEELFFLKTLQTKYSPVLAMRIAYTLKYAHMNTINALRSIQYIYSFLHDFKKQHVDLSVIRYIFHTMHRASEMIIFEISESGPNSEDDQTACKPLSEVKRGQECYFLYDTLYAIAGFYTIWKNRSKNYDVRHPETEHFDYNQIENASAYNNTHVQQTPHGLEYDNHLMDRLTETMSALDEKIIEHAVAVNNVNRLIVRNQAQALDIVNLTNVKNCTMGYDPRFNQFYEIYPNDNNPDGSSRHYGRMQEDALCGPGFRLAHNQHATRQQRRSGMTTEEKNQAIKSFEKERTEIGRAFSDHTGGNVMVHANLMRDNLTLPNTQDHGSIVNTVSSGEEILPPASNPTTTTAVTKKQKAKASKKKK